MIWGEGRNEVQIDPLLPPTYIFFAPQLTPYNIFLTKMLYGGVHARLSMKNLYGGVHARFFMYARQGGSYNIFTSSQGGIQHFSLCFKGGIQHFYSTKDPATFSFSKRCTTFCMCQRLRCLLRSTLVPDQNIVSTLTVT